MAAPEGLRQRHSRERHDPAIAGQIGWDASGRFPGGMAQQVGQALRNIVTVLETGGGRIEDLVRLTWFVTSVEAYRSEVREIGAAYRAVLGRHFPVMSVVQCRAGGAGGHGRDRGDGRAARP